MSLKNKLSYKDVDFSNKRVFLRVDFNVPLDKKTHTITNLQRINEAVPTIQHILNSNCRTLVLASHLGRPNGKVTSSLSLRPVAAALKDILSCNVMFLEDCVGEKVTSAVNGAPKGTVILLENLRFHPEEEGSSVDENKNKVKSSPESVAKFRSQLSELGDVYVNDAFGTAHRAHSSMVGFKCQQRAAGGLLNKELTYFSKAMESPPRPFLSIMGGAKVEDKIQLIMNLMDKVDEMIIGGGMAFTFEKVLHNMEIGGSLFDAKGAEIIPQIMAKAAEKGVKIHLPTDYVTGESFSPDTPSKTCTRDEGIAVGMGLDVGPNSVKQFQEVISRAKIIVWNGPMGVFEFEKFSAGTKGVLEGVEKVTKEGCVSIIGGGDTATCVTKFSSADKFSHISTGGGASLELLEGKALPGVAALSDKPM